MDDADPVNTTALTTSLKLEVTTIAAGQRVGVANEGFWGIPVFPNTQYHASFYAKAGDGLTGPLTVDIESNDGATVYATGSVPAIDAQWKKYDLTLTTSKVDPTANARLRHFRRRQRDALAQPRLPFPADVQQPSQRQSHRPDADARRSCTPHFLRFPGGNYLEGNTIDDRVRLEEYHRRSGATSRTPGPVGIPLIRWPGPARISRLVRRPAHAAGAGRFRRIRPDPPPRRRRADLQPFVQEALDEIEYCTGDASTKWGQERAKDGHPDPFKIQYVEIGNEDQFDRPNGNYDERFAQFYDAIKAKYPKLQLIATTPVQSRTPDVIDDHYYRSSRAMERDVHHYDKTDRNGPKIFVGEWATTEGRPTPNFGAALADAAWMTGLERNSDIVVMNCYAPLLVNVNINASQWGTNLIGYDAISSFGSASYHAQKMFAQNLGDTEFPVDISEQKPDQPTPPPPAPTGGIGVATWNTQAQFKDIKVTKGDQVLFQSDFSQNTNGWRCRGGEWNVADGALTQTSDATNCRMTAGDPDWTDYTLRLKARKTGGSEGFLVMFHVRGRNDFIWWNVGGWGNTRSSCRKSPKDRTQTWEPPLPSRSTLIAGTTFGLNFAGTDIKCYLDDKLITEATDRYRSPTRRLRHRQPGRFQRRR